MMSALMDYNTLNLTDCQHEAIKQLTEVIRNDHPSIKIQQDNYFLTKYLIANDWNVQEAIRKIICSYRLKKQFPDWYTKGRVSDYLPIMQGHSRYMLTDRDKHGRRVFVYKLDKFHLHGMDLRISSQIDDMYFDAMLMDQLTQCKGLCVIIDCKKISKSIIKWLIPKDIKVSSEKSNIFPCKNLYVHMVNVSSMLNVISKVVAPLLSENFKSKFHFHQNDWTLLHEFLGKDCLPEEYGGPTGKVVEYEKSYKFLLDRENILLENMKYGIIDSKTGKK